MSFGDGDEIGSGRTPDVALVSVIVPTYGAESLTPLLASLQAQDCPPDSFEIIVVDNNDEPRYRVSEAAFERVVWEPTPGSYAARNAGIRAARGDVLAFTDSDCIASPTWLSAAKSLVAAGHDRVAGAVDLTVTSCPSLAERYEQLFGFPQGTYVSHGFAATANLVVNRKVFDAVGPFDHRLMSGGDYEFGLRASRAGIGLVYCEAASVRHPARTTVSELRSKKRRTSAGQAARAYLEGGRRAQLANVFRRSVPPVRKIHRICRATELSMRTRLGMVFVTLVVWTDGVRSRIGMLRSMPCQAPRT